MLLRFTRQKERRQEKITPKKDCLWENQGNMTESSK